MLIWLELRHACEILYFHFSRIEILKYRLNILRRVFNVCVCLFYFPPTKFFSIYINYNKKILTIVCKYFNTEYLKVLSVILYKSEKNNNIQTSRTK